MKKSLLTYSAWISLVLIAFSCRSPEIILKGYPEEKEYIADGPGTTGKFIYKATVAYKDKELTGRILVKKNDDGNYRVAFYNEMGMTYLDGTMEKTSKRSRFVVNNIIPVLDNTIFLRNFEKALDKVI